jgi:hypothetical protein
MSIDQISTASFIIYFSDNSFVNVTLADFLTKFPDRFMLEDLGHISSYN